MSRILLFAILLCINATQLFAGKFVEGEYRMDLSGYWSFKSDPENMGEEAKWYGISVADECWDRMAVPGSWELTNAYSTYIGKAWYRTTFDTPQNASGRVVYLEFEAVSMSYRVYVNGKFVAEEAVGNYKERFDITPFLNKSGKNTLAVMIDNSVIWGAYCSWGGFRRPVNVCVVDPIHTLRQEVVAMPDLKRNTSSVAVKAFVENTSDQSSRIEVVAEILNQKQETIKTLRKEVTLAVRATTAEQFDFKLSKKQTVLWDIDHPNLYTSRITVLSEGKVLNRYTDRFGIRKVEFCGKKLMLNGKSVRLAGYNWVADDRTSGSMLPEWRYKEDIDRMKQGGANMARLSHRPLPEDVMDYLDEVGFLTVSEYNNWQPYYNSRAEEPRTFARKLIHQQYNHPSVIGWSVGNEMGNYSEYPETNDYIASMIKYIKQNLDPNRFVLYVSNTADWQKDDAADYGDFIMINKYANYEKALKILKEKYPDKPVFVSEYGGYGINVIYDTPNNSSCSKMMMDCALGMDHVFGFSIWTFNDYRSVYQSTLVTSATPLHQNRQWGVVDCYRNKKRSYQQLRKFYSPVTSLEVTNDKNKTGLVQSLITLTPRGILDIPAFELTDYSLVWEVRNMANRVVNGGLINLPAIVPGSKPLSFPIQWQVDNETAYLNVALISPTGYNVADCRVDMHAPAAPEFKVLEGANSFRVLFERSSLASEYYLKYKMDGVVRKSKPTIDHYIDISSGTRNKDIELCLVAVNGAGETESEKTVVKTKYGHESLPPVIWQIQPCDRGFFIGQSYVFNHYYYVVRYTTDPTNEKSWKYVQNRNLGMCRVSGLKNGVKYYFQIANTIQFGGKYQQSVWSEMREVIPSADRAIGTPAMHGVLRQAEDAVFICTPARDGAAYELQYTLNGKPMAYAIDRAVFDYVIVKGIGKGKIENAKLVRIR